MRLGRAWFAVVTLGVLSVGALFTVEEEPSGADAAAASDVAATASTAATGAPGESTTTTAAPSSQKAPSTTKKPAANKASGSGGQSTPTTQPPTQPIVETSPGFPLTVTLGKACVTHGDTQTVTMTTRGWSSVAAAAVYKDNEPHGALTVGNADPTGTWTWAFVVEDKAPEGPAQVILSVQDRAPGSNQDGASTNGEGGTGRFPFTVKDKC